MIGHDPALLRSYREHFSMLRTLAKKILRMFPDEVEDVLQETWFRAQRAWPPREIGYVKTWLGKIVINLSLGRLRRIERANDKRVHPRDDYDDPIDLAVSPDPPPDEIAVRRHEAARLRAAVATLPDGYRAIVRLRYFEGLSEAEIVERLGRAPGTVKSQHHKAIAKLREALKPHAA